MLLGLPAAAQIDPQKLLPTDGEKRDRFGRAVALEGDTLVVTAPGDDDAGLSTGAAYVFVRDGAGFWVEQQKLLASAPRRRGNFGAAAALEGDTLLIGDPGRAVYVFMRDAGGFWTEEQKLSRPSGAVDFGRSLALQGDTALIGAQYTDNQTGAVYVFTRNAAGVWSERQKIPGSVTLDSCSSNPCNSSSPGLFGMALTLEGDSAIIGAPMENGGTGAAYVIERDAGGLWSAKQRLANDDGEPLDFFGATLTLHGDAAIIGAFHEGDRSVVYDSPGSAYVFERDSGGMWSQTQRLSAENADARTQFASEIVMNADIALFATTGPPCLFERDEVGNWTERQEMIPGSLFSLSGHALALDRGTAAIGASADDVNGLLSGSVSMIAVPRTIDIEVLKGSINPKARGTIAVAILGSNEIDVSEIDTETLSLGLGEASPAHSPGMYLDDVNADGRVDQVVHFWNGQTGIECGHEMVILRGLTNTGQPIRGAAGIRTAGCRLNR